MRKYKWGIIAPGKIAKKFAADLSLTENGILHSVSSRSLKNASEFAERFGAKKYFDDHHQLLADPEVDVIYVATPHAFHKEITIDCLKAGKPVLCEKPMGMNAGEVADMINVAKQQGVFLMEALWTAFLPHYQYVKKLIVGGKIGNVNFLISDFGFQANYNESHRLFNKQLGGGSLLDIGIYPVFCAMDLLGIPRTIKADAVFSASGVDAQTHAIFSYNDLIALISSSLLATTATETKIYGDRGMVRICGRWHEPASVEVTLDGQTELKSFDVSGIGYHYEATEVMKCLDAGRTESDIMPLLKSRDLSALIDRIKTEINLSYQ